MGVFIKHLLKDGTSFLALYAHIQVNGLKTGDLVYGGVEFAKIGLYGGGNHLHFGIFPGLNYPATNWGKIPSPGQPPYNGFVNPINWINTKTPAPMVAKYSNSTLSQPILARYQQSTNEGHPLGLPRDNNGGGIYVHNWNGVVLQDFYGSNTGFYHGYASIMLNAEGTTGFLLKEGFWSHYMNNNGAVVYGAARSDEVSNWLDKTGAYGQAEKTYQSAQEFEKAVMLWDGVSLSTRQRNSNVSIASTFVVAGGPSEPDTPDTTPEVPADTATSELMFLPPGSFTMQAEVGQSVNQVFITRNKGQTAISGSIDVPYPLVLVSGGVFSNLINGDIYTTVSFTPEEAMDKEVVVRLVTNVGNKYVAVRLISTSSSVPTPTFTAPPTPTNTPQPDGVLFFSGFENGNPFIKEDHFTADYPNGSVNIFEVQTGVGIDGGKGLVAGNTGVRVNYEVQVKVVGGNVSLQQGKQYRVSGYLRADNNGTISVEVCKNEDDWHSYGLYEDIQVSTGWQYFSFTFTAAGNPQLDININRLSFMRGTLVGNLYLDDIKLELVSVTSTATPRPTNTSTPIPQQIQPTNTPTNTATPTKQQTAPDDFTPTPTTKATLMPTVTPTKVVESINTIFSTDFEDGNPFITEDHWNPEYPQGSINLFMVQTGVGYNKSKGLVCGNTGERLEYQVQIKTVGNIQFQHGKTYTVSGWVKADNSGEVAIQVCKDENDWHGYGLYEKIIITNSWHYFQFTFTADNHPEQDVGINRLSFMLGRILGNVYLDDITVTTP